MAYSTPRRSRASIVRSLKKAESIRVSIRADGAADALDARLHEGDRSVGVVHVSAAVQRVEDLAAPRQRAEERVVASRALPLVEAGRDALCLAAGRDHAAVEVQRDRRQPLENQTPVLRLKFGYSRLVALVQHSADGRNAGNPLHSQGPFDDRVLAVQVHLAQPSHSQQGVDDEQAEQQREAGVPIGSRLGRSLREPGAQPQIREELLENDQPAVGAQVLPLELQSWNRGFSCSEKRFW